MGRGIKSTEKWALPGAHGIPPFLGLSLQHEFLLGLLTKLVSRSLNLSAALSVKWVHNLIII